MHLPVSRRRDFSVRAAAPTLALLVLAYGVWIGATIRADTLGLAISVPLIALALAQHSSLQHEIIHGHPFADQRLNAALVFPALGLLVPFVRFRDMHLAHHHDPSLTDPYDDPESNYLDPRVWPRLHPLVRGLLIANNTLLGRMILGPPIGLACMWRSDLDAIRRGEPGVLIAYLWHAASLAPVLLWLGFVAEVPAAAYGLACWLALGILRIRTFLEHRAHERAGARSVIIEDRGPLSILFLNNNFHAVHHAHPNLPWHRLPAEYLQRREAFLRRNGGYRYRSYAQVFGLYLFRTKDPVAHPFGAEARPDPQPAAEARLAPPALGGLSLPA